MATRSGHPILQFGTSRFLQAHADLFVSQAAETGDAIGGITVVQSTGNASSTARTAAMARDEGFPVIVRGLVKGQRVEQELRCRSVREAFHAHAHWPEIRDRMRGPVEVVISNTGDKGWVLSAADTPEALGTGAAAPEAFPAKLLVLLHDRWLVRPDAGLSILPCELVSRNGDRLRDLVLGLAGSWDCPPAFKDWLAHRVVWANSLVDRIVSEPLEPVGAVAEPYALWAVEDQPALRLPCSHPSLVLTGDLLRFERLKLHLLNLGHSVLADLWLREGGNAGKSLHPDMTVVRAMQTPALREPLESVWQHEVLPVFDAWGLGDDARSYLEELRDRLMNPFLAHRLADIAQNHVEKKARRLSPIVEFAREHLPALRQPLLLTALLPN